MIEKILSVGSSVEPGYTSSYTVDTSTTKSYKFTIISVSSNDFNCAYMCFDAAISRDKASRIYYFAQITNGSTNSRNPLISCL